MSLRLRPWALALATTLLVAGCDPLPSLDRIGVSLTADGDVQVHYAACSPGDIEQVRVFIPGADVRRSDDDTVLWLAVGEKRPTQTAEGTPFNLGTPVRTFSTAETPAGFEVVKNLEQEVRDIEGSIHAEVVESGSRVDVGFFPSELPTDEIKTNDSGIVSIATFKSIAAEYCEGLE